MADLLYYKRAALKYALELLAICEESGNCIVCLGSADELPWDGEHTNPSCIYYQAELTIKQAACGKGE